MGAGRVFLGSVLSRTRPNSKFEAGLGSHLEIREESTFTLPQVIGEIHLLAAVGLRSQFLAGCQLGDLLSS